jgi:L-alanine-DL-glutamate epimerase-like enolase superfamily enzyme
MSILTNSTQIRIVNLKSDRKSYDYRTPIKFGGRVVKDVSLQRTCITLELDGKKQGHGIGEMTMGTAWAWPSKSMSAEQVLRVVSALYDRVAAVATKIEFGTNPIDHAMRLKDEAKKIAVELAEAMKLSEPIPELAVMLACSSIDAAIHDAFGRLHDAGSFACINRELVPETLDKWLGLEFAGKHLSEYVSSKPVETLPLYHLVGGLDPLSDADLGQRVGDGLPETLEEWIQAEQLTHLKLKLCGTDLDWDVGRTIEVDRIASNSGSARPWSFSLDFNEACPNEDYVIDFIERIDRLSRTAIERLQYIEQPSARDLKLRKEVTMHRVSRLKPVVIDESLIDMDSLLTARQLGYTGIALKACKGISESLLMAAAAKHYGMFLCVQDLTCIGSSFLQSASLAAHIPGIKAVEGNGRQYCPAGNKYWEELYRPMFRIMGGVVPTELLTGQGLGFRWPKKLLPKGYESLAS